MSRSLVISYVASLLCLLLGAPFLLFEVGRRARGSALSIAHGVMIGIGVGAVSLLLAPIADGVLRGLRLSLPEGSFEVALAAATWAVAVEGVRALALARVSKHVRTARSAAHFGLGWGCGVAAFKGILLLIFLKATLDADLQQALASMPAARQEEFRALLEQQRVYLLEAPLLRPPLEHVLRYGLDAFYHLAFTLIVVRTWTHGERGAWLRAAGLHAALNALAGAALAGWPGWAGLIAVLLVQGALVAPTYRWMARQIVRTEA